MTDTLFLTSPVGRLVMGDAWKGKWEGHGGVPYTDKQNQPIQKWFVGVAIPKGPEWDALWAQIHAKGAADFPGGEYLQPGFSWKIDDGDTVTNIGKPGRTGCWILKMQSNFAPTCWQGNPAVQLVDPAALRKGCYVQVGFGCRGNGPDNRGNPGVFINANQILLAGFGEEISSGPDASQAFANRGALPPGASAVPLAAATVPGAPVGAGTAPIAVAPLVAVAPPVAAAPAIVVPVTPAAPLAAPLAAAPPVAAPPPMPGAPVIVAPAPAAVAPPIAAPPVPGAPAAVAAPTAAPVVAPVVGGLGPAPGFLGTPVAAPVAVAPVAAVGAIIGYNADGSPVYQGY